MDRDIFKTDWNQIKNKVREKWAKLTDEDLSRINGKREQLIEILQKRYGYSRDKVEENLRSFEKTCSSCSDSKESQSNLSNANSRLDRPNRQENNREDSRSDNEEVEAKPRSRTDQY
jgi:uncharacterized protein YjbJ (UPF0337 family)